jgi:hypothetical protein
MGFGVARVLTGRTAQLITLSVSARFGSLRDLDDLPSRCARGRTAAPFRAIGYPVVPAVALSLAVVWLAR